MKADHSTQNGESEICFNLESWPFYWLIRADRQYLASIERMLHEIDLDIPAWRVLMLLEGEQAHSMSYLAREAITKLPTMVRIVQRMRADQLVDTRQRDSDGRVTEVFLLPQGHRARLRAWKAVDPIYVRAFAGIPEADIGKLNEILSKLCANLAEIEC